MFDGTFGYSELLELSWAKKEMEKHDEQNGTFHDDNEDKQCQAKGGRRILEMTPIPTE